YTPCVESQPDCSVLYPGESYSTAELGNIDEAALNRFVTMLVSGSGTERFVTLTFSRSAGNDYQAFFDTLVERDRIFAKNLVASDGVMPFYIMAYESDGAGNL